MEAINQPQAKFRGAQFCVPHPVVVTEQHADPVELVFQAFLRLDPEQRMRLIQQLKWRFGEPPKPLRLNGRVRSSPRGGWAGSRILNGGAKRQRQTIRLRNKNADLGNKIKEVLQNHPELRDLADKIALKQGMWVQVGTSFLERVQTNLQERARAIVERRPDLEHLFDLDR
jgi:hypothetical protein